MVTVLAEHEGLKLMYSMTLVPYGYLPAEICGLFL
nr:MAG TPA: hypothetical protein [Caudoviricetes sp.]